MRKLKLKLTYDTKPTFAREEHLGDLSLTCISKDVPLREEVVCEFEHEGGRQDAQTHGIGRSRA